MNQKEQLHEKLKNILEKNYQVQPPKHILLVYDTQCKLSSLLAAAYQEAIKPYPHQSIDFDNVPERYILDAFAQLPANSLVILVQSGSFRMTKYRLRADLFRQGHQVIEHARLSFNAEDQIGNYIDSLNYDTPYYLNKTANPYTISSINYKSDKIWLRIINKTMLRKYTMFL